MTKVSVASDRFWREFKSDVDGTLSDEQRGEIQRVLNLSSVPGGNEVGDLRLSCKWFFVRLVWGREKRSPERVKQEEEMHPAMSRGNAPMLASLFAGYMAFWYTAVGLSAGLIAYYVS